MFRVGMIGCGGISAVHARVLGELENTQLIACADMIPERAARYGCKAYADWREMLDRERPDAVHLCTPHCLHPGMVSEAARRGIAVFTEKPPAIDAAGWEQVKDAARHAPAGVCFQNRYHPHILSCGRFLREGTYGDLKGIRLMGFRDICGLFYLGLICSAVCYMMWNEAIADIGAMTANLYVYAVPVVTMIASAVFLSEAITWGGAVGVVLVVGGMLLSNVNRRISE